MKGILSNLIKPLMIIPVLAFAGGCDVHEWPGNEPPMPTERRVYLKLHYHAGDMPLYTTVEYDPDAPGGVSSRSTDQTEYDFRYIVNVYDGDTPSKVAVRTLSGSMTVTRPVDGTSLDRTIPLDLPPGNYTFKVWSDYVDPGQYSDKYYDTSDFSYMSILQPDGTHPGDIDQRDAFRGTAELGLTVDDLTGTDDIVVTAEMHRPLARYRFVATDYAEFINGRDAQGKQPDDYRVVVVYPRYMPSAYNIFSDKPTDSRTGQAFNADLKPIDDHSAQLGFDYVFVGTAESTVQVALQVYSRKTNKPLTSTTSINVPLVRGRTTEIRGKFLTTTASSGVGISPGFDGDYNIEII